MAVSWDGRVSLIGFRGVAIGSPATAAAAGFRRSSEETRGKGGESDATELLLLEFFLGRLREGSGWHLQSNAFSTPFSCSVFLLLNLCLLFLAVAYSSQYEMSR